MPVESLLEYQRIWVEGVNRGDLSAADAAFAPDCVVRDGTHTGPLGPVQPTGRTMAIDGLILDRVVGGKVQERWEQWDQSIMLQQLGLA